MEHKGIQIDLSRDSLFDELGLKRLRESYMRKDETSPQQRFAYVADSFGSNPGHKQRMYDYLSKHWLSASTPILSFGRGKRNLPISCFLPYIDDTAEGLVETSTETKWLSIYGGGVGLGLGMRAADDKSTGVMPHLRGYDADANAYKQDGRRGSIAAYLDISHPDIKLFLDMRKPTGDQNIRCLNLHHGINVTDEFMEKIERLTLDKTEKDEWELRDPFSGVVKDVVSARDLWQKIILTRALTGEPYLHFIDTSNRALPEFQKKLGLKIRQSNLCTEIMLATNKDRTAVCCLSSFNAMYYDLYKDDMQFFRDVLEFMDNVLQYFIDNAPADKFKRAIYSASRERSIGLGMLGFHSYLQSKHVAYESVIAKSINIQMSKNIATKVEAVNQELGTLRGEAPDAVGTGKRFSLTGAIAPNASSSIIMGNISPSKETIRANAYRQDTLSGAFINKNRQLDAIIQKMCAVNAELDAGEIWESIVSNDGSIQHLDIFDDTTKWVYKTAMEIDQRWVIEHAADTQMFIDQGMSVNLFFLPTADIKYIHAIIMLAWKKGLKSLYYHRSEKILKADKVNNKIERIRMPEIDLQSIADGATCLACE